MRPFLVLCAVIILLSLAHVVYSVPVSPSGLNVLSTGTRTVSGTTTLGAQGGNVTAVNIDALSVTRTWQGYFGNITGNVRLDDANNVSFYSWGNGTTMSGEVYASRNNSLNWSSINCSNVTQREQEETDLGVVAADADSVTNTFNSTSHPDIIIGTRTIAQNTCYSTNVNVNGTAQNTTFHQVLLADNWNSTVYTAIIANDQYGYNSQLVDFQLLVGENEHDGSSGPTTYYFYVELN